MPSLFSPSNHSLAPRKYASDWILLAILSAMMAFTSLSLDIYLPAIPQMQIEFKGNIELTITGFLFGFALAQLFWGPVSDVIGRKKPLYLGLLFFIMGSVGCAFATTIQTIIFWRVFQAIGASTGPMLARAIVRDLFSSVKAAQVLSTLSIIMAIAPIAGPIIGGQLLKYFTWHSVFWLLAGFGSIMLICVYFLPETHSPQTKTPLSLKLSLKNYGLLLKNWQFMRYTLCVTFYYAAFFCFLVASPFIYINYYDIPVAQYGGYFGINVIGMVLAGLLNRRLVNYFSLNVLIKTAMTIALCSLSLLLILFICHQANLYWVMLCVFIFFATNGIIVACSIAAALENVGNLAGSASALMGSLQYGSGIISSLIWSMIAIQQPIIMALIMTIFVALSLIIILIPEHAQNPI